MSNQEIVNLDMYTLQAIVAARLGVRPDAVMFMATRDRPGADYICASIKTESRAVEEILGKPGALSDIDTRIEQLRREREQMIKSVTDTIRQRIPVRDEP